MVEDNNFLLLYSSSLRETKTFYESLGFRTTPSADSLIVKLDNLKLLFLDQTKSAFKINAKNKKGEGVFIYIKTNVDEMFANLKDKGLNPSSKPKNWPWGNREFVIKDPDGYSVVFYKTR